MTPDCERIEREAAIILRNLRNGLTEERTAKSITALVLRERAAALEMAARVARIASDAHVDTLCDGSTRCDCPEQIEALAAQERAT